MLGDEMVMVLDVTRAKKIRVMANRYKGALEKNEVLLARIDNKSKQVVALQLLNALSAAQTKDYKYIAQNKTRIIVLKDQEIKKLKNQRIFFVIGILGALLI